uniref:Nudcd2-like protein n=1 Tax=Marsilea vestita TaxID=59764 RepID=I6XPG0_MARVE|nr:nudcd2-like protein [Marsilea vestita]
MTEKLAPSERHKFVYNGQTVFEWDQTLARSINLPKEVPRKLFTCTIRTNHIEVGIKGNPPYLNHDLAGPVKLDSSFWTIGRYFTHNLSRFYVKNLVHKIGSMSNNNRLCNWLNEVDSEDETKAGIID